MFLHKRSKRFVLVFKHALTLEKSKNIKIDEKSKLNELRRKKGVKVNFYLQRKRSLPPNGKVIMIGAELQLPANY